MNNSNHVWSFSTVGGVKRVNLETGADLLALEQLDQKLWTALSCPVSGLEIDSKTLALIDSDGDGQKHSHNKIKIAINRMKIKHFFFTVSACFKF